jgi:DNA-binding MarR family transcriptional regulator
MTTDERPVRALARLSRLLENSCEGVTLPQYRVLALIGSGNERATRLAHRLALTKPSVSTAVDALVERGLIRRDPAPDDGRAVQLALTPAGRQALLSTEAGMQDRLDLVLAECEDRAVIVDALHQLEVALDTVIDARQAARRAAAGATEATEATAIVTTRPTIHSTGRSA